MMHARSVMPNATLDHDLFVRARSGDRQALQDL